MLRHFVEFQRQPIGILEKRKAPACEFIDSDRLKLDAMPFNVGNCSIKIKHAKGKMPQPAGFRSAGPRRRVGKAEEFKLSAIALGKVQLPGTALFPVVLSQNVKTKHITIECL